AAFSTGTSYTVVLSFVAIVAACAVLWVSRRLGSAGWAVALGFLLAGVLGNLTDRVFRAPGFLHGHVVDFLQLPHWPVFNVADMFGLSRTRAAELITEGHVAVDGRPPAKSARVEAGSMLDVAIPASVDPVAVVPEMVEGIKILHDDDAIVVVDKPVGVAVHP